MWYIIVRIVIIILVSGAMMLLYRKHRKGNGSQRWFLIIILAIAIIVSAMPFENFFFHFSSPEQASYYQKNGDILHVIEGEQSSMVLYKTGLYDNSFAIYPKDTDGWKLETFLTQTKPSTCYERGCLISIYHVRNTQDFYIELLFPQISNRVPVSDHLKSDFTVLEQEISGYDLKTVVYYTYVHDIDQNYTLMMDGHEIHLDCSELSVT